MREDSYIVPRQRGCIVLFDSHNTELEKSKGTRKSIVGWTVGPRWSEVDVLIWVRTSD